MIFTAKSAKIFRNPDRHREQSFYFERKNARKVAKTQSLFESPPVLTGGLLFMYQKGFSQTKNCLAKAFFVHPAKAGRNSFQFKKKLANLA
ncbi:MAG TPA: hypothetical protein VFQ56_03930 [Flavobacterium sp.]|nr:hypothetical protein [Flavobacterium sp.]